MNSARTMITFKNEHGRFTYRIAGIIIHNGCVLFQASMDERAFWFLPGGRAELNETAAETLRREMQEELGVVVTSERLLCVMENFFGYPDATHPHHEVGFYFLITFPSDCYLYQESGPFKRRDDDMDLDFAWLPLGQLAQLPIYPVAIKDVLQHIPDQIEHLVHHSV